MSEAPSWQHMWGAKVKMPCDMDDDVLEDAIKVVTSRLSKYDTEEWEKNGLSVCEEIKAHLDTQWDPHWVVCIGRNYGSFVTHVTCNFVFFYFNEKAIMLYKADLHIHCQGIGRNRCHLVHLFPTYTCSRALRILAAQVPVIVGSARRSQIGISIGHNVSSEQFIHMFGFKRYSNMGDSSYHGDDYRWHNLLEACDEFITRLEE